MEDKHKKYMNIQNFKVKADEYLFALKSQSNTRNNNINKVYNSFSIKNSKNELCINHNLKSQSNKKLTNINQIGANEKEKKILELKNEIANIQNQIVEELKSKQKYSVNTYNAQNLNNVNNNVEKFLTQKNTSDTNNNKEIISGKKRDNSTRNFDNNRTKSNNKIKNTSKSSNNFFNNKNIQSINYYCSNHKNIILQSKSSFIQNKTKNKNVNNKNNGNFSSTNPNKFYTIKTMNTKLNTNKNSNNFNIPKSKNKNSDFMNIQTNLYKVIDKYFMYYELKKNKKNEQKNKI